MARTGIAKARTLTGTALAMAAAWPLAAAVGSWASPGGPQSSDPAQEPAEFPSEKPTGETGKDPADDLGALLRQLPARTKLGRARSVRIRSTVTFQALPDQPHGLAVDFAFPGRTRFELSNGQGGLRERYQLGAAVFAREVRPSLRPEERASRPLGGREALEVTLDLAARRALFCWPDGREWAPGAEGSDHLVAVLPGVGRLVATPPAAPNEGPGTVQAVRLDGEVASRLVATEWTKVEGRPWPARVRLMNGTGDLIWTETVDAVEATWFLGDLWFVPKDRVGALAGRAGAARLRLRSHGAVWVRREPLTRVKGKGVEAVALARWSALRDELGKHAQGHRPRLARVVSLVLDAEGLPRAMEFECDGPRAPDVGEEGAGAPPWVRRGPGLAWHDQPPTPLGPDQLPTADDIERLTDAARRSAKAQGTRQGSELLLRLTVDPGQEPGRTPRIEARIMTAPVKAPAGEGGR